MIECSEWCSFHQIKPFWEAFIHTDLHFSLQHDLVFIARLMAVSTLFNAIFRGKAIKLEGVPLQLFFHAGLKEAAWCFVVFAMKNLSVWYVVAFVWTKAKESYVTDRQVSRIYKALAEINIFSLAPKQSALTKQKCLVSRTIKRICKILYKRKYKK